MNASRPLASYGSKNNSVPHRLQVGTERHLEGFGPLPPFFRSSLMRCGRGWVKEGGCFEPSQLSLTSHSLFCGRVWAPVAVVLCCLLLISEEAEDSTSVHGHVPGRIRGQGQTALFASELLFQLGWSHHLKTPVLEQALDSR